MLNKDLIKRQNLSAEDVATLEKLHKELDDVVNNPYNYTNPVALIEDIEFQMQRLWKFGENRDMHTHWLRIKGCTCPRLDNMERRGTPYRVLMGDCPWHGFKGETK